MSLQTRSRTDHLYQYPLSAIGRTLWHLKKKNSWCNSVVIKLLAFDRKNGVNLILPISVKSNIQKRPSASVPASFLIHSIGILKKQLMLHKWLFTTAAVWQKKMWAWFEFDWMLCGGVFVESKNDAHYASTSAKVLRSSVQTVWIGLGNRYVNQTLKGGGILVDSVCVNSSGHFFRVNFRRQYLGEFQWTFSRWILVDTLSS